MTNGAPLLLFNSLTRSIERLVPIDPRMVRVYSCGPTVYSDAHLGNLRAYVFTDTLRRVLNWKGWPTNHVINITDVGHLTSDADEGEDKMELAASRSETTIWDVAAHYTAAFKADLGVLNVRPPTLWSTATDHIQDMIAFARAIEAAGATYELAGGLYFDVAKVPDYGRLAGALADDAVGRIDAVAGKRNPADFAVWRRSPRDARRQMEWASPWGRGAPGWHLECSVMSMKYLGAQFDIHTGGIDHREIHHCNEIAQNQAFTGSAATGANLWMHNNFLVDHGAKMSKSKGGFATLRSLVDAGVHPLAYRLLCVSAQYRSELEFSPETIRAALTRLRRLLLTIDKHGLRDDEEVDALIGDAAYSRGAPLDFLRDRLERDLPDRAAGHVAAFDAAISEDLNTPKALTVLDAMLGDTSLAREAKVRLLASFDAVLGLDLNRMRAIDLRVRPADATLADGEVEALLAERKAARAARDFATSDALRETLSAAGVEIMDGDPLGWDWRPRLA